jgi:hypothetical protein
VLLPIARQFQPSLTLISAGFDAARGDPLGGCDVTPQGYGHLTKQLMEVTPEGKVVLVLEGGYNLTAIATSFAECVRVLQAPTETAKAAALAKALGGAGGARTDGGAYLPRAYPGPLLPSKMAMAAVRATVRRLEAFWKLRPSSAAASLGGGFCAGESSYATCPRVVSRFPGRQWAFCFNAPHFTGRLTRFARARRWKRAEFDFLAIDASDDESIASSSTGEVLAGEVERSSDDEAAYMQAVLGEGGSDESIASESSNGDDESSEEDEGSDEEAAYWKAQKSGNGDDESSEGSEEEEDEEAESESSDEDESDSSEAESDSSDEGRSNGEPFAFKFELPAGVELVRSEDSFTPFEQPRPRVGKKTKRMRNGDTPETANKKGSKKTRQ